MSIVHGFDGRQIDADGVDDRRRFESELQEKVRVIHFLTRQRVSKPGAGNVALRPDAVVKATVRTTVAMVSDVVNVVLIEEDWRSLWAGKEIGRNGGIRFARRLVPWTSDDQRLVPWSSSPL